MIAPIHSIVSEHVHEIMERMLQASGIYKLTSYGFTGPDDYDDEYIGHAMWQTDSLSFHVLEDRIDAMHSDNHQPRSLMPWQEFLVTSGEDFEGLMAAARLSLGMTLFQSEASDRNHYGEDSFFQMHLVASAVILGMASDRLRDIFIAGVFHQSTREYSDSRDKKDKPGRYTTPFSEAISTLSGVSKLIVESANTLKPMSEQIHVFRGLRNEIVHGIATELGRQQRALLKTRPPRISRTFDSAALSEFQEKEDRAYTARVTGDIERIVSWYKLLIDASNHVFIVENHLRAVEKTYP